MKSPLILIVLLCSAGSLNLAARTQEAAPPNAWQESPLDNPSNEPRRQFNLAGKFLLRPPGNSEDFPRLIVKCAPNRRAGGKGKFRVGAVFVGSPVKIHMVEPPERKGGISYYPEVSVSYRLDDGKPVVDDWPPRFDKSSAEFDKNTFKKILLAHTLLVKLTDADDHEISMQFDMPDSSATPFTSAQVAEACGIYELKK